MVKTDSLGNGYASQSKLEPVELRSVLYKGPQERDMNVQTCVRKLTFGVIARDKTRRLILDILHNVPWEFFSHVHDPISKRIENDVSDVGYIVRCFLGNGLKSGGDVEVRCNIQRPLKAAFDIAGHTRDCDISAVHEG